MATLNLPIDASLPTTEQAFSIRVPNGGGVAILGSADGTNPENGLGGIGVRGNAGGTGSTGVFGEGDIGMVAVGRSTGIMGSGPTGVSGQGAIGVSGEAKSTASVPGYGVRGHGGERGRGGLFQSVGSAQVRLDPAGVAGLPKGGLGGDLLVLRDTRGICTLWFCEKSQDATPARWAPVQLGPRVEV